MKVVNIVVEQPPKFVKSSEDREFGHVGQKLAGYVQLSEAGKPKSIEIRWLDFKGRLLGRTKGKYERYNRRVHFEFDVRDNPFWLHRVECELDGAVAPVQAHFAITPTTQGWETAPAVTWATYPEGDFHDRLHELGVNGEIAFKMKQFENVAGHGMRFYIDNSTPEEISIYHRPHVLFWEPSPDAKPPYYPWSGHFRDNWDQIRNRYARMRDRAKKEGLTVSRDIHYQKMLWRDWCPNNPGTLTVAKQRLEGVVRQHKGFRPLFYNMADEAGITDQTKAFDYCYCPHCMTKFRQEMERKYVTLGELNRVWGTDFENWHDVCPLTTDETMDAQAKGKPLNFAAWNDHRAFMDDTFAGFFAEVRRHGLQWDPIGDFSQGGCQAPAAFGGWDYTKVIEGVDALIPYNIGGNQEIIRSLRPGLKNLSPFFGDNEVHIRGLWYAYIHGDAGVVFWDADGDGGRFVERPSGKVSQRGKRFGPALREIRGGYSQQFKLWGREHDSIGLLYSHPSLRAWWLAEAMDRKGKSEFFAVDGDDGRYKSVRMSWQQLIEDRQVQYRYVGYRGLDEGTENLGEFRLLILPEAVSISAEQANALRDFVHRGGVLVADGRVGRLDGNLRQVDGGMLDDLFGVEHTGDVSLKGGAKLRAVPEKDDPWILFDRDALGAVNALDAGLRLARGRGAEAAATAGKAPAVIRRRVGNGWAVLLNADISTYEKDRYFIDRPRAILLRELLDVLIDMAGIDLPLAVEEHTLGGEAGIEVTRFGQAGCELVAALMNRAFRLSGVGEQMEKNTLDVFEADRDVTLYFDQPAHTWNSRTGDYLGSKDQIEATVPRLTPLILARLPYKVSRLDVDLPKSIEQGKTATVKFEIVADARPADHVVRVDVYRPDGTWAYWYSGTTTAAAGVGSWDVHLCLCSAAGRWKVVVRDTVTGKEVSRTLRVTKAKK